MSPAGFGGSDLSAGRVGGVQSENHHTVPTENHHKITNSHNLCPFLDVYLHINKLKKEKETGILLVGNSGTGMGRAKVTQGGLEPKLRTGMWPLGVHSSPHPACTPPAESAMERDRYMSPMEAQEFGIMDKVLVHPPQDGEGGRASTEGARGANSRRPPQHLRTGLPLFSQEKQSASLRAPPH